MKKINLWMLAAILFCGLTATVLSSCSKDDDNSSSSDTNAAFTKIKIVYTAETTQSTLDAFNVKAYRANSDGVTEPVTLSGTSWTETIEIPASKAPCTIEMYMVTTPKDATGTSSKLSFGVGKTVQVITLDANGKEINVKKDGTVLHSSDIIDGTSLAEIAKNSNNGESRVIITIDKNGNINK